MGTVSLPQAVLFDLDGTLIDSYELILRSFRHATQCVLHRVIPDDELMQKVGQPLATQMWDFTDNEDVQQELLRVYREFNHAEHDAAIRAFDGVADMLAQLQRQGVRLGVVTSKVHWLAQRGLEVSGLDEFFELVVASDDLVAHKPDPAPVLYACRSMGLEPDACWYVGDSPFDIAAGNAASCFTVAVTWGMFSEQVLLKEAPDVVCDTPQQIALLIR